MCALGAVLGLLLLGTLQAFPKDRPLKTPCAGDHNYYPGEAVGSCCYHCPSGWSPTQLCPQGPAHCRKQCKPDYYLNEDGLCTACVSCLRDLVEKAPCSWNSSRVCECQPGRYCQTQAVNSCARCEMHSACPAGMVVRYPGTAEKDTECEWPSPETRPDCINPEDCKTLTRATPQATPTLKSPVTASIRSMQPGEGTSLAQEDTAGLLWAPKPPSSQARKPSPDPGVAQTDTTLELPRTLPDDSTPGNSEEPASTTSTQSAPVDTRPIRKQPTSTASPFSTGTPFLDPGPVLFWVTMVLLLVVVGSSSLLLCHWKACRRRIRQKLHLYYPAQTFRPQLQQADTLPTELTQLRRSGSMTEPGTGQLSSTSPPTVETCANVGAACLESLPLLDDGQAGIPLAPRDPPEPRVSTEQTNNRIEKIYIMKADTVIVGTVKTEVPEGRLPGGSAGPELEAELEVDRAPHYPEQETEPPLGSCTEVMFSVEEEGKEDHRPTAVSEK